MAVHMQHGVDVQQSLVIRTEARIMVEQTWSYACRQVETDAGLRADIVVSMAVDMQHGLVSSPVGVVGVELHMQPDAGAYASQTASRGYNVVHAELEKQQGQAGRQCNACAGRGLQALGGVVGCCSVLAMADPGVAARASCTSVFDCTTSGESRDPHLILQPGCS